MGQLIRQLRKVLSTGFPGAEIDLEQAAPADKAGGFIVWEGFSDTDHVDRQKQLWKLLRTKLSRADQPKITAIFAMTPDEMSAAKEG